ncbi:hypothetical protein [Adhaeribacter radiodurans]|uniref:Uncharacterized protein n=1 Tax=Adhaeribacter radiodurans TaxID=2745197 RepID=A0A7L7L4L0_9BACT|nr:hypothetical protein [Adhaeribacter radiodurans]QMU27525.1 hypothetical protein HUW48_05495 [Adhaeribacter radiodurans]
MGQLFIEIKVYVEPIGSIIDNTITALKVYSGLSHDLLLSYVIDLPIGHWRIFKMTRKDGTPLLIRNAVSVIPNKNVSHLDFYFAQNTSMYCIEAPL